MECFGTSLWKPRNRQYISGMSVECLDSDLLGGPGFTSFSVEPLLMALLFAQAFSLGGGAGTTFKGSPSCLDEEAWLPGEGGSSSRPLKTSFSKERSLSRRLEPAIGCVSSLSNKKNNVCLGQL